MNGLRLFQRFNWMLESFFKIKWKCLHAKVFSRTCSNTKSLKELIRSTKSWRNRLHLSFRLYWHPKHFQKKCDICCMPRDRTMILNWRKQSGLTIWTNKHSMTLFQVLYMNHWSFKSLTLHWHSIEWSQFGDISMDYGHRGHFKRNKLKCSDWKPTEPVFCPNLTLCLNQV